MAPIVWQKFLSFCRTNTDIQYEPIIEYTISLAANFRYLYKVGQCQTNKYRVKHLIYQVITLFYIIRVFIGFEILFNSPWKFESYKNNDHFMYFILNSFFGRDMFITMALILLGIYAMMVNFFMLSWATALRFFDKD